MSMPAMTAAATPPAGVVVAQQLVTPWMTVDETAIYTRRSRSYLLAAIRTCKRTKGREGLKAEQERPNAAYRVHVEDAVRWMSGQPPLKGTRKALPLTTETWLCLQCRMSYPGECDGKCTTAGPTTSN